MLSKRSKGWPVFRRWLMALAVLAAAGLIPVYAFRTLGAASAYAVLADAVQVNGSVGTATIVNDVAAGGGAGRVGGTPVSLGVDATLTTAGGTDQTAAVDTALTAAGLAANAYYNEALNLPGVDPGGDLSAAGVLTPGVYYHNGNTTLSAGDLTLTGAGDYLIVIDGDLTTTAGSDLLLAGGAAPANVYLVVNGNVTIGGSQLNAEVIANGNITTSTGTVVNGKLIAAGTITFNDDNTVNDAGLGPQISSTGSVTYNVCVGQNVNYTISATDPDGSGNTTLDSTAIPATATHTPALPQTSANPSTTFDWTPAAAGTTIITYTATDETNAIDTYTVTINVSAPPALTVNGFTGFAAGTGTAGDPYLLCPGDTLDYNIASTDPDGDQVTLTLVTNPAGTANISHGTPLPQGPVLNLANTGSFNPAEAQEGLTVHFTYTSTDNSAAACATSVDFYAQVTNLPDFTAPSAGPVDIFNVCVGDLLQYDIRANDADAGDTLQLSAVGTPLGALHGPDFAGVDVAGPGGGNILAFGNPVESRFEWAPTLADVGTYLVTYTVVDDLGCSRNLAVIINVSQKPTLAVTSGGNPVAEGDTLTVCAGQTLDFSVAGTDPDGDVVTLTGANLPANLTPSTNPLAVAAPTATVNETFAPVLAQGSQTYTLIYTATDPFGCAATRTVSIYVSSPPVFNQPVSTTVNACVGDALRIPVRASDADAGDVVTLTSGALPGTATLDPALPTNGNPASTEIVWTPNAAGSSVVNFTATDTKGCTATQTVTINVSARPTISATGFAGGQGGTGTAADPVRVCVGNTLTYTVNANSGEVGESVTVSATGAPAGLTHIPALPASGTPTVAPAASFVPTASQGGQTFTVTYTATDGSGGACTATTSVVIKVSNVPVFDLPTATTFNVCAGTPLTFPVRASDADTGDVVTLTSGALPGTATMTPALPVNGNPASSTFAWTPAAAGTSNVTFTATDASGCATTQVVTINVSAVPVLSITPAAGASHGTGTAADPYVLCPPGTSPASTLTYSVTASDTDATQTVTLAQTGAPAGTHTPALPQTGAAGAPVSSAFSFTPTAGDAGQTFTINYTATDNSGAACAATGTVVIRVSALPQITASQNTVNLCVGQSATFRVRGTDAESNLVTLSQSNAPASLVFVPGLPLGGNPVETVATFTPTDADAGSRVVTFTATDEDGCSQTTTVTLNVSRVPTVAVTGVTGASHGTGTAADPYIVCPPGTGPADTLSYTVTAADPDAGQTVTLSETGSPAGSTYTPTLPQTGAAGASVPSVFSYTPAAGDAGQTFTVTYTATDNFTPACTATTTVVIRVGNLPVFDGATPANNAVFNTCVGQNVTFRVHASDADSGDQVTLSETGGLAAFFTPSLPTTGNPVESVFNWTPGAGAPSTATLVFTATDSAGCAVTRTITINVSRVPTVTVTGVTGAGHGTGTAADPYVLCPPGTSAASTLTYTVTGADADAADTVTLSETGSPAGGSYNPTLPHTGAAGAASATAFSFTPVAADAGQTYTVTYTATDNSGAACSSSTTVVIHVTNLPVITASRSTVNLCVGQSAPFRVRATDADGGIVTLTQSGAPASLDFAPGLPLGGNPVETVATFTPTDADAGTRVVTFTATDTDGCSSTTTVTLSVSRAPTVALGAVTGAISGSGTAASPYVVCPPGTSPASTLSYTVTAADPDTQQTVTLSQSGAPSGGNHVQSLPATGVPGATVGTTFTYTPSANDAGQTYTVTYTATDNFNPNCTATTTVVIRVDQLPVFNGSTPAANAVFNTCVGQNVTFRVRATDADSGDQVSLSHTGGLASFFTPSLPTSGNPVESVFSWTPGAGAPATTTLVFTATDNAGCSVSRTITINVSAIPTVAVSGVTGAISGNGTAASPYVVCPPGTGPAGTLGYTVMGADPDAGDAVTLTQSGSPASATYNPTLPRTGATGGSVSTAFSFTPVAGDAGQTYTVTYTATDDSAAACSSSTTVVIRVANLPQFTAPSQTTYNVCAGTALQFTVRATDADNGETVALTSTALPAGATLTPTVLTAGNPVEAQFNWTPATAGTFTVTFTATDSSGCAQTRTVTINVSSVPTLSLGGITGSQHGTGSAADPLVVCVTPAVPLSFTVTAADGDVSDTLTLTQSGAPGGATFNVTGTNPAVGTFSFSPTVQQGGQSYAVTFSVGDSSAAGCGSTLTVNIRVSSLPVINATASNLVLCEGQPIAFRLKASDTDPGNVTIGEPTVVASEGAPALNLTYTQSLPASGNPVETAVSGTAPSVTADALYTLTYPATDADGCSVTKVVTITVRTTPPTTVQLSRHGDGDPFGEEICYTALVLDNCPASEGGPRPVPGVQVVFTVSGETGNSGVFLATTDANGEATYCLTPRFPGTLTVSAGIDADGDGVADSGLTVATDTVTVPAPVQVGAACFVSGQGRVNVNNPAFGNIPVIGQFNMDISPRSNGKFRGTMTFTVTGAGTARGKRANIQIRSTRIDSMACVEGDTGRTGVIFGQASVKGMGPQGLTGTVPFRVDALDAGNPGAPGDRFVLTFLNPTTNLPVGPIGGNLVIEGRRAPKDDVRVRVGVPVR